MTKAESLDCVAVKHRAQRALAKNLAGKSPGEQAELIHRLAARTSLWQSLTKVQPRRATRTVRPQRKRRSTG